MKPRLFCEFPAGLAAVSLRLQGGAHCRPPISRMGNKAGYSKVILGVLGLHSGQGAGAYWWAEADQDVAALLQIYPDPEALMEVARIIRGWADEEPRALWERLRAERKERGSRSDPGDVAGWIVSGAWNFEAGAQEHGFVGPDGRRCGAVGLSDRAARLAEYAMITASNRLICVSGPDLMNTGAGGTRHGGEFATAPEAVAEGMERVAKFSFLHQGSFQHKGPEAGIGRPEGIPDGMDGHGAVRPVACILGDAFPRLTDRGWPSVCVSPRIPTAAKVSAAIGTPGDLEGCIVYSDPPYIGTTPYAHSLSRAAVVAMARDFAAMGATVAISEQVALTDLTGEGWHTVEITGGRVGQKRTFSDQQKEMITMNREPDFKIAQQEGMFGLPDAPAPKRVKGRGTAAPVRAQAVEVVEQVGLFGGGR